MSDEHKLYRDVDRAAKAERLLNDELFKEGFEILRKTILDAWIGTSIRDALTREKLWHEYHLVGKLKEHYELAVSNGKLAVHELNMRYGGKKAA